MHLFEQLAYSTDPSLGNVTVDPSNLGTGLWFTVESSEKAAFDVTDDFKQSLESEKFIKYETSGSGFKLSTCATLAG